MNIDDLLSILNVRPRDSHKGTYGTVLIVGGSRGMSGAAVLAGRAALRGGAGLTRLAVPEGILPTVAAMQAEYTTIPLPEDAAGRIAEGAWEEIRRQAESADVVAVGPGLGKSEGLAVLMWRIWTELERPVILDADGLNMLAETLHAPLAGEFCARKHVRIVTPHPGEFYRLAGITQKLSGDLLRARAITWAREHGCVTVLKGEGTLVTDGESSWRNPTGNPGMATGGSGDVLTGLMAALAAQLLRKEVSPADVARLAVYLHGKAGDFAAKEVGEVSLIAGDIIRFLPEAIQN